MNSPWVVILLGLFSLLGTGGGLAALLTIRGQRRTIDATADATMVGAVKVLIGSATDQARALDEELKEVRAELVTVRRKADALERQLDVAGRKMAHLASMIHDPYMTLDRLRVMVPDPAGDRT